MHPIWYDAENCQLLPNCQISHNRSDPDPLCTTLTKVRAWPTLIQLLTYYQIFPLLIGKYVSCSKKIFCFFFSMNSQDHRQYPCDNRSYTWRLYFERIIPGLKKNFFKEDLNNVKEAKQALRKKELTVSSILAVFFTFILFQLYYLLFWIQYTI